MTMPNAPVQNPTQPVNAPVQPDPNSQDDDSQDGVTPPTIVQPVKFNDSEDVRKLLEKVRNEEKKKLYGTIDHLKEQVGKEQREKEALIKALEQREQEGKSKKEKELSEAEKITQQFEELRRQNLELQTKQRLMEEEAKKANERARTEAYKAEAIRRAGGPSELIPEMVLGNSEAEIDASIIISKRKFAEIKASAEAIFKAQMTSTPVPGMSNPPSNPSGQPAGRPGADEITAEMLANMSDEDWVKHRMEVRKAADTSMKTFFNRPRR